MDYADIQNAKNIYIEVINTYRELIVHTGRSTSESREIDRIDATEFSRQVQALNNILLMVQQTQSELNILVEGVNQDIRKLSEAVHRRVRFDVGAAVTLNLIALASEHLSQEKYNLSSGQRSIVAAAKNISLGADFINARVLSPLAGDNSRLALEQLQVYHAELTRQNEGLSELLYFHNEAAKACNDYGRIVGYLSLQ